VSATTVRKILRASHLGRAHTRVGTRWREFIRAQARTLTPSISSRADTLSDSRSNQKFTDTFDQIFHAQGIGIVLTPIQVPEADGIAEMNRPRTECAKLNRPGRWPPPGCAVPRGMNPPSSRRRYRHFSLPHNYWVQRWHELEGPTSRHRGRARQEITTCDSSSGW
jgi:hypothetical protein